MRPFEDVVIKWDGREFVIPSDALMGAIRRVEKHLTLRELYQMHGSGRLELATIAAAFAALLQYAGCEDATDLQVYASFGDGETNNVLLAVQSLLELMVPAPGSVSEADVSAGKKKPAAARSSRKPSGRRSAPGA